MKDSELYRKRIQRLFLDFTHALIESNVLDENLLEKELAKFIDEWMDSYFIDTYFFNLCRMEERGND